MSALGDELLLSITGDPTGFPGEKLPEAEEGAETLQALTTASGLTITGSALDQS